MNWLSRGTFAFAISLGVTNPPALAAKDACSLVSTAEIERVIGKKLEAKPSVYSLPGDGSTCTYQGGQIQIVVFSGMGSDKKYDAYLANSMKSAARTGAPDQRRFPVSGVGRSAYYTCPKPAVAILVVNTGSHTVGVSMVKSYDMTAESLKPKLMAIAKTAASRL